MTPSDIKEILAEENEDAVVFDGIDEAIVGIGYNQGKYPVLIYDEEKVLDIYIKNGMSPEEAMEYFEYNTLGTQVDEGTPIFIKIMRESFSSGKIMVIKK